MDFLETMGMAFLLALALLAFALLLHFTQDIPENTFCEGMGYATEIHIRGEDYCIGFKEGVLSSAAVVGMDDGKYALEQEFILIGVE